MRKLMYCFFCLTAFGYFSASAQEPSTAPPEVFSRLEAVIAEGTTDCPAVEPVKNALTPEYLWYARNEPRFGLNHLFTAAINVIGDIRFKLCDGLTVSFESKTFSGEDPYQPWGVAICGTPSLSPCAYIGIDGRLIDGLLISSREMSKLECALQHCMSSMTQDQFWETFLEALEE